MHNNVAWWREPTKPQWISFFAAWVGWVLDAFDFTIFLLVIPEISKEFGVTYAATAGAITMTLIVRLLGGWASGVAADRWGRKLPLMLSLLWFAAFDGAIAFAGSFTMVLVLRTVFGFGMGAEWTAGTTLAMENWPSRSRGIASGVLQGSWAVGYLLAGLVAGWIVPHFGWRALFLVAAVPALLVLPIRIWVPESEEWKASRDKKKEKVAQPAFTPAVISRMIWASCVLAIAFAAYYGLTGLYPTMLKTELDLDPVRVGNVVALFNLGMMAGAVICGTIATKRNMAVAIMLPAMLVLPFLPLYVGTVDSLLGVGAFLGGAFGAGYCGVSPLLLSSLFPSNIRARASGIVYHVGAFAAAFVPMTMAQLAQSMSVPLSHVIGIGVGAFQVALAALILFRPRALSVLGPSVTEAPAAQPLTSVGK